jgi:truncated hemoglobin YjbI
MKPKIFVNAAGVAAVLLGLTGCGGMSSMGSTASLYQQLGGTDSITKMANSLVSSSMKDPRLSGAFGNVNSSAASTKVADQLCSALGGGCTAPYTDQQVQAAADKLTPDQKTAISDNFSSSLNSVTSNSALKDAVTKSLGSKMSGILGAIR